MSDIVSIRLLHLQYPTLSLAEKFGMSSQTILRDAVRLIFDRYEDMYFENGHKNLPAAYDNAYDYIEGAVMLFEKYERDFPMTPLERHSALAAWLCQDCIDPSDPDKWDMIGPEALSILAFLEKDVNAFPILSEAGADPALAINVGLRLWTAMDFRAEYYRGKRASDLFLIDPDVDRHHAFRILNDRPPVTTALGADCQKRAKDVIDALRGRVLGRHIHPL